MTAGNLAVTQATVNRVIEGGPPPAPGVDPPPTLYTVASMSDAARLVGEAVRDVFRQDGQALMAQNFGFDAAFLLAGQIKGRRLRLFQIYSAGNYIEATTDTPFLQIGEHKYGKPILDRVARYDTPIEDAVKLAMISMDSTLRSNLSVGLPADLMIYRRDALKIALRCRITDEDPYFRSIREGWSAALRAAYQAIPAPPWNMD
jgi:putative proteasome-type protease